MFHSWPVFVWVALEVATFKWHEENEKTQVGSKNNVTRKCKGLRRLIMLSTKTKVFSWGRTIVGLLARFLQRHLGEINETIIIDAKLLAVGSRQSAFSFH